MDVVVENGIARPIVAQQTFHLSDGPGAIAAQKAEIGAPAPKYDPITNNCAQHCSRVLNAGGVQAPTRVSELMSWWSEQLKKR